VVGAVAPDQAPALDGHPFPVWTHVVALAGFAVVRARVERHVHATVLQALDAPLVVARAADPDVRGAIGEGVDDVVAGPRSDDVGAGAVERLELVIACAALDPVVPGTAFDQVAAAAPVDRVVTGVAEQALGWSTKDRPARTVAVGAESP
jgi:hypothetical protein